MRPQSSRQSFLVILSRRHLLFKAMTTSLNATSQGIQSYPPASIPGGMNNPQTPFEVTGIVGEAPQSIGARFRVWLDNASPGEVFVYATCQVLDHATPPDVLAVALAARESFARGEIELVQPSRNGRRESL